MDVEATFTQSPSREAAAALEGFAAYARDLQRQSLDKGVPYAITNDRDELVFIHPNGTTRETQSPTSRVIG